MKRARSLVLIIGAAGLLAAGVWLGRRTSNVGAEAALQAREATVTIAPATADSSGGAGAPRQVSALRPPNVAPIPGLAVDLADPEPKVRRAAVREAARTASTEPGVFLVASRDPDLEVAIVATDALGRLYAAGHIDAAELIARVTDRSLDTRVRTTALNGIGLVASPHAAELLLELLARGSTEERASAAILLVHQDPDLAIPALIRTLGDSDPQVQANALEALRSRSRGRDFGTDAAAWHAWWASRPREGPRSASGSGF